MEESNKKKDAINKALNEFINQYRSSTSGDWQTFILGFNAGWDSLSDSVSKEFYVVIQCGYEGIDGLIFATKDSDKAATKIKVLRESIVKAKQHREQILSEFGTEQDGNYEDAWDRLYTSKKITHDEFENGKYNDPDSYCIKKWDGTNFICVCSELEVKPSKNWIM